MTDIEHAKAIRSILSLLVMAMNDAAADGVQSEVTFQRHIRCGDQVKEWRAGAAIARVSEL